MYRSTIVSAKPSNKAERERQSDKGKSEGKPRFAYLVLLPRTEYHADGAQFYHNYYEYIVCTEYYYAVYLGTDGRSTRWAVNLLGESVRFQLSGRRAKHYLHSNRLRLTRRKAEGPRHLSYRASYYN